MRARMSDATARQTFVEWHAPCPQCALDEARSILAKNEPQDDPDWPRRYTVHSAYYATLADSLAALCDTLDVAAYLAEMQTR